MLGNPQLDPEVNHQLDVRLAWTPTPGSGLQVDLFAALLHDYISSRIRPDLAPRLASAPGVRQYVNIGRARLAGFEVRWDQALGGGWRHEVTGAYTRGQDLEDDAPLPEIPPLDLRYRLAGRLAAGRWQPQLTLRHVASQERVSAAFGEIPSAAFEVVDARVAWRATPRWSLTAGVDNLLDEAYYEHLSRATRTAEARPIYSEGRSLFLMLTSRWP
jgi:iron complex outermembrane receptor protein